MGVYLRFDWVFVVIGAYLMYSAVSLWRYSNYFVLSLIGVLGFVTFISGAELIKKHKKDYVLLWKGLYYIVYLWRYILMFVFALAFKEYILGEGTAVPFILIAFIITFLYIMVIDEVLLHWLKKEGKVKQAFG